jgi:hypothetical protein
VRRRPYSVVLFDEIEKAHPEVLNVMLQLLDDGRLTDGKGRTVDFRNAVVIMTSNLGSQYIAEAASRGAADDDAVGAPALDEGVRRQVTDTLRAHFRPEFLNRVDEIIYFHALSRAHIKQVIDIQLKGLLRRLEDRKVHVTLTDEAKDFLVAEGYDPIYGARPLKRTIQRRVLDPLALQVLDGSVGEGDHVTIDTGADGLTFTGAAPREPLVSEGTASVDNGQLTRTMHLTTPTLPPRGTKDARPTPPRPTMIWYVLGAMLLIACCRRCSSRPPGSRSPTASSRTSCVPARWPRSRSARPPSGACCGSRTAPTFSTSRMDDPKLIEELESQNVRYTGEASTRWMSDILGWVMPMLLIIGFWMFFLRRMGGAEGSVMSFAKSKAKIWPKTT